MLKILIVDDEKLARGRITRFLKAAMGERAYSANEAENGLQAIELLERAKPDLVFLDIEMPGMTGIELLAQIPQEKRAFQIVFQTAHDEFALKAFEENAVDYLLKPFDEARFGKALAKALAAVDSGRPQELGTVEKAFRAREGFLERLSVRQGAKLRIVDAGGVSCFVSRDHCTCIHLDGSPVELITDLSIGHLEERLDPARFWRVHRNAIIAVDRIRSVKGGENMTVTLLNGMEIAVSRSNRARILDHVKN